ncbi:hypothetical protein OS493_027804 [Desmophyllum pertusum]|uniref:Kinesin light chain n=1 Tax=Desmophyllum pertusum TaxID=174260 RepID=A0A9W9YX73_9CNID|nr:hypothetical protein OS493_027804 [Desmophyllum pertusum]
MMAPHLKVFSSHLKSSNWASDTTTKTYFEYALQIANGENEGEGNSHDRINFIATILNNVGVVYWKLGQFGQAEDHHQHALALLERLNPQNPTPEIADSLNKLGNVSYSLSQFEKAKDYYYRSLSMREELYGDEDATVAASLNNLGSIHSVLGEHHIAKDYYQKSLDLAEKTYGKIHPHVAQSFV